MCAKKKKLLMDVSALGNIEFYGASRSGIFFVTYNLLKEFLKCTDLQLALYTKTAYYNNIKKSIKIVGIDPNIKIYTDSKICALYNFFKFKYNYSKKIIYRIYQILLMPLALFAKIGIFIFPKKYDEEIFFSTFNYPSYSIRRQKKMKKYVYLHDCIHIQGIYNKKYIDKYFVNEVFNKIEKENFYFTNSEYTRQDFIKYNPNVSEENSKTVLLAAADNFKPSKENFEEIKKKYNIPDGKKYIFSLCTLEPRKNLIRIVKTFVEFIKKHNIDDIVFVMGGGQWEKFKEELAKAIDNLSEYKDKIIKIGYVQDEDLPILYSNAEWFVYTSQYEGFGLPPLEAMSCGCPVIVSNSTSLPEVVGDAGIQINYDSDEEHVEAYEKFYFNPELRAEYSKKGLLRASIFSYKKTADELLSKMLAD